VLDSYGVHIVSEKARIEICVATYDYKVGAVCDRKILRDNGTRARFTGADDDNVIGC